PCTPIPAEPASASLRTISGQFRLTIPNTYSTITVPASLRSDCCSPSLRNAVRLPSGIDVPLPRNTQREPAATQVFRLGYLRCHDCGGGGDDGYILKYSHTAEGPASRFRLGCLRSNMAGVPTLRALGVGLLATGRAIAAGANFSTFSFGIGRFNHCFF